MSEYLLTVGTGVQSSIGTAMSAAATYTYTTGCATDDNFDNNATLSTASTKCWTTSNAVAPIMFSIIGGSLQMEVPAEISTEAGTPTAQKSFPNTTLMTVTVRLAFTGMDDTSARCKLTLQDSGEGPSTEGVSIYVMQQFMGTNDAVQAHRIRFEQSPTVEVEQLSSVIYLRLSLFFGQITASWSSDGIGYNNLGAPFSGIGLTGPILVKLGVDHYSGATAASCIWDDFVVTKVTAIGQD